MSETYEKDNLIEHASAEQILNFLVSNGSIDLGGVEDEMTKARRKKILENHPFAMAQHKDGRWRTYVKDETKPNGRRLIAKSTREKLEDAVCAIYEKEGEVRKKPEPCMASLFEPWMRYKALHVAETTASRIRRDWERYYAGTEFIHRPVRKITKLDADIWVHEMIREHEMNKHQYANFSLIIRQILDYAVDLGKIRKNPFRDVRVNGRQVLKPEHKKADETQVFTKAEQEALQEAAWNDFNKRDHPVHQLTPLAVMFMFFTGLRVGEVCAIRHEDIRNDMLTVRRMVRHPSNEVVEQTKGAYGERTIPLVPQAKKLIEAAMQRQCEEGADTDGYVFSMNDEPLLYSSVTKAFYAYCKEIGIEPKSSHKARKTFVSTLIDSGMNLNTVRQLVGHVDERTTLNNYCYDRSSSEEKIQRMTEALS